MSSGFSVTIFGGQRCRKREFVLAPGWLSSDNISILGSDQKSLGGVGSTWISIWDPFFQDWCGIYSCGHGVFSGGYPKVGQMEVGLL